MGQPREKFAVIMHDIRNAVSVVLLNAEFIERAPTATEAGQQLNAAIADMRQGAQMLRDAVERLAQWKEERDG